MKSEIVLSKQEANLDGARFEKMIISKFSKLKAIPKPVHPAFTSSYTTGGFGGGGNEPIVDAFYELAGNRRMLVEIKKGFKHLDGYPLLCTSQEQISLVANGINVEGKSYLPGEYWVFTRARDEYKKQRQKWTVTRIPNKAVKFLSKKFSSKFVELPDAVRV